MAPNFPVIPAITLFDPLAQFLGAGDGMFTYVFDDAVKLSGHACPTVAGAYLMTIRALDVLYVGETAVRGGIQISIPGTVAEGVSGPISQVFTLLTGATAENGFHGLGGQHKRDGLMQFLPGADGGFLFRRMDNGKAVEVSYDATSIPPNPEMSQWMPQAMQGEEQAQTEFREMWRERVVRILEDRGEQTVTVLSRE